MALHATFCPKHLWGKSAFPCLKIHNLFSIPALLRVSHLMSHSYDDSDSQFCMLTGFRPPAPQPVVVIEDSDDSEEDDIAQSDEEAYVPVSTEEQHRVACLDLASNSSATFYADMPDRSMLRFASCLAVYHAVQLFYACGGARPDLAAKFAADGELGCLSGARTQRRYFRKLLQREGVVIDASWADSCQREMRDAICSRAVVDQAFARHCKAAARQGLPRSVPYGHLIKRVGQALLL